MINRTYTVRLSLLFVAVLFAAACSGEATEATDATAPADETATTAEEAADSTAPEEESSADGPDILLGVGCTAALSSMAQAGGAVSSAVAGGPFEEDVAEQLRAMSEAAPEEIADDLEVFADQMEILVGALEGVDFQQGEIPTEEQMAELEAAFEAIDEEALEEASDNIEAWLDANC